MQYLIANRKITMFLCFFGIIFFYSYYSYLQELLLADKSLKLNVNVVMGFQNVIGLLISLIILKASYNASLVECLHPGDFIVGGLTFGSMYCSNFALKFVDYPFMVLAKSAKTIPIIIVGGLRGVYKITKMQIIMALMITAGLIIFDSNKLKKLDLDNILGIALILSSLIFDGLVSS